MIKIYIKKQSNYPIRAATVKRQLRVFLEKEGLVSDFSVSISFVGEEVMKDISRKHLGEEDSIHSVLSFTESETRGEFKYPKDLLTPLGEIVVCYPEAAREANDEGKLIDEKVIELVKHGAEHLLGKHHD